MRCREVRFLITIIWALLIGSTLGYVLASIGEESFSLVQSIVYGVIVFIIIIGLDAALNKPMDER